MVKINEFLLKAIAMALNLEENSFLVLYGEEATMISVYNLYPPCPRPDLAIGLKPHADGTAFTYLLQDKEVEALQVLKMINGIEFQSFRKLLLLTLEIK